MAAGASRRDIRSARCDRSPVVLSATKSAPWLRKSRQVTTPPSRVKGVTIVSRPPVIWWAAPGTRESAGTWEAGTTAPLEVWTTSMCMP